MRFTLSALLLVSALSAAPTHAAAQEAAMVPVPFGERMEGLLSDPLGIWSEDELAESQQYTRQWMINGAINIGGREVIVSMLFGDLCSLKECPLRVLIKSKDDDLVQVLPATKGEFKFQMVCQSPDQIMISADGSSLQACGAEYPISFPS